MARTNRRNNRVRRNRIVAPRNRRSILSPPPFKSTVSVSKKLRFQSSAALVNTPITVLDCLSTFVVANTTTSATTIFSNIRLRSIEMWGAMPSTLVPVTVTCEFPSMATLLSGPAQVHSDTSIGSARPAHIKAAPKAGYIQSMWQSATSGAQMFLLNGPANTIVDITFDYVLQNGETPITVTVAAASVGSVYLRALDSQGSSLLVPISYVTI